MWNNIASSSKTVRKLEAVPQLLAAGAEPSFNKVADAQDCAGGQCRASRGGDGHRKGQSSVQGNVRLRVPHRVHRSQRKPMSS